MANYTATLTRSYSVKYWNWPNVAASQGYWGTGSDNPYSGFIAFDIASMRANWNSGQRISSCSLYFKRSGGNWGSARNLHCYASKINPAALPGVKPADAITANRLTGVLYDIACPALTVNGQWCTVTVPNAIVEELIANGAGTGIQFEYSGTSDYMYTGDSTTTNLPVLTINWYDPVTACGAPTACSLSSALAEGNVTLSWSGASNGTGNTISSYEIQYSESSDNSTWGAWTALTTVTTTATSGSVTVSPPTTRGYYRRFQVRTRGTAGSSYYSGWKVSTNSLRKNTLPAAPTSVTASPATYFNENITLSWSGTVAGSSAIKQYNIEQATSIDNATWSAYSAHSTVTSGATSGSKVITPTTVAGTYTKYRISVTDTLNAVSGYSYSNSIYAEITACGAPTICSVNSTLAESSVTLSWSGASSGAGNTISSYEIEYSESSDNTNWGSWLALTTLATTATSGSLTVAPSSTRGNYRRYRVRTRGTAGSGFYSGWKTSTNTLRKNTLPVPPASFTVSPEIYQQNNVTLAWSGAVAGTSAIKQYVIQYCTSTNNTTWTSWSGLTAVDSSATSGSLVVTPSSVAGTYTKYRICVVDVLDAVSGYVTSNAIKRNSPPAMPVVAAPKAGSTTFNRTPRILIQTGTEPDGQQQAVWVRKADGQWQDSESHADRFSQSGYLGNNAATTYVHEPLTPGSKIITVKAKDQDVLSDSMEISRSFTVASSPFTAIDPNQTSVRAEHMTCLQDAVNAVRNYFSLPAVIWKEEIIPGKTPVQNWTYHILELRKALDEVISLINAFDLVSGFDVPFVNWIAIGPGRPKAAVMLQLQDLILTL